VYSTDSVGLAEQYGREVFGDHRLDVRDDERPDFHASFHAVQLHDITIGYLDFVSATHVVADQLPDDYTIFMAMNGSAQITNLDQTIVTNSVTAAIAAPRTDAEMLWEKLSPHLIVRMRREALHLHLTRLIGRSLHQDLHFDLALDMSSAASNRWSTAIQLLNTELFQDGSLLHLGVGTGPLEEFVMSALLFTCPSNYSSWLAHPERSPGRRAVRQAVAYIESHLAEELTIGQIAGAAQVGIRSLQEGFQSEMSCTPSAYVRDRRLDRARLDLVEASPSDAVTVTDIAVRWGFTHLGRFAATYRQRFGETPSQTLRG
jgi:AraC-like DNA-binding protein